MKLPFFLTFFPFLLLYSPIYPSLHHTLSKSQTPSYNFISYNIRYDNPNDGADRWDERKEAVVQLLDHYEAVVFGIQEGLLHQLNFIDEQMPTYTYLGVGRDDGKQKGEFTAIFYDSTKVKPVAHSTFWLSETPEKISVGWDASMERICTYALFETVANEKKFWVFNTHFDHIGPEARLQSANLILEMINKLNVEKHPVVLMGDFNALPDSPPIKAILKVLEDGKAVSKKSFYGPTGTFNGFDTQRIMEGRIDYIFVSPDVLVKNYRHIDDRRINNRHVSDHLAILAGVQFK